MVAFSQNSQTRPTGPAAKQNEPAPITLSRALIAENVSFSVYVILLAIASSEAQSCHIVRLADATGQSYHALLNQSNRSPLLKRLSPPGAWGANHVTGPLLRITYTEGGRAKLESILKRLARYKEEAAGAGTTEATAAA